VAVAAGIDTIVATPHVSWTYRNTAEAIGQACQKLRTAIADAGIGLKIHGGAEIALSLAPELADEELSQLALGDGRWLLVEPPFSASITGLDLIADALIARGHRLLLAHPERCPGFQRDRRMLDALVEMGVQLSVTAGALTGRFGRDPQRLSIALMREGKVCNVASDAHDAVRRPPVLEAPLDRAGFGSEADWLCRAVPDAIVSGDALPKRPAQQGRGALARLFRA
jgi:protein-tyrosine phosphatase